MTDRKVMVELFSNRKYSIDTSDITYFMQRLRCRDPPIQGGDPSELAKSSENAQPSVDSQILHACDSGGWQFQRVRRRKTRLASIF